MNICLFLKYGDFVHRVLDELLFLETRLGKMMCSPYGHGFHFVFATQIRCLKFLGFEFHWCMENSMLLADWLGIF